MTKNELLKSFKQLFKQYCEEHNNFDRWFEIKKDSFSQPNQFIVYIIEPNIFGEDPYAYDDNIKIKGGCCKWIFEGESSSKLKVTQYALRYDDVDWDPKDIDEVEQYFTITKNLEDEIDQEIVEKIFKRIQTFLKKYKFKNAKNQNEENIVKTSSKINPNVWEIFRVFKG